MFIMKRIPVRKTNPLLLQNFLGYFTVPGVSEKTEKFFVRWRRNS